MMSRMGRATVLIGEPYPEVFGLLERLVRHLGHEPLRMRPSMRDEPPHADAVVLDEGFPLGRELAGVLRRRNPGLAVVYLRKPFRLEELRRSLDVALSQSRRTTRLTVSVGPRTAA
jgi:hypothetical protein